jgi:hypothetical protein
VRQAQNKIDQMDLVLKKSGEVSGSISFSKLISLCSKEERRWMYTGYAFAVLAGGVQPVTMLIWGRFMGKGGE